MNNSSHPTVNTLAESSAIGCLQGKSLKHRAKWKPRASAEFAHMRPSGLCSIGEVKESRAALDSSRAIRTFFRLWSTHSSILEDSPIWRYTFCSQGSVSSLSTLVLQVKQLKLSTDWWRASSNRKRRIFTGLAERRPIWRQNPFWSKDWFAGMVGRNCPKYRQASSLKMVWGEGSCCFFG